MQDEITTKLTNAIIGQSTSNERVVAALDRLEARMAVQPSAPMFDPRTLIARAILVASAGALVGSCTALAWVSR